MAYIWACYMILYDNFTMLSYKTLTSLHAHYITTTLNMNTRNAIHVITIYKPKTLLMSTFLYRVKNI